MSEVSKPKPKYGWTEEKAQEALVSAEVAGDPCFPSPKDLASFPTNDAGEAYIVQETTSLGVEIQTFDESFIGPEELPCHLYGGDGGSLPRERPGGRLEEILQCKARAPIAESPWASFAAQVVKFTGARRAIPSNVPGEIRVAKGDHYCGYSDEAGHIYQDSVYVGVPVA